ncbi:hypothetical protein C8Q77DRAFT_1142796 [Trametes polyzona]|nr:hypothetical protein C8Q77DRAFT_1142796 [Trametes polyzona]
MSEKEEDKKNTETNTETDTEANTETNTDPEPTAGPPWIPMESNPEVMTKWAVRAGMVENSAHFEDVYGLDGPALQLLSRPVKAFILLFPMAEPYEIRRRNEDGRIQQRGQYGIDQDVFYIKQTIPNACGTIALLHALINSNITFAPESPIQKFIEICKDKTPLERAQILEKTPLFADIHKDAASGGQTAVPQDLNVNLHFTAFIAAPDPGLRDPSEQGKIFHRFIGRGMRLIELDGRRIGPIDRGPITQFSLDVAKYVQTVYIGHTPNVNFSMMALCGGRAKEYWEVRDAELPLDV